MVRCKKEVRVKGFWESLAELKGVQFIMDHADACLMFAGAVIGGGFKYAASKNEYKDVIHGIAVGGNIVEIPCRDVKALKQL